VDTVTRIFDVDDIRIRPRSAGGDGRIVDAYAAVFGIPAEVSDDDGHYREQNHPSAFNRSINSRADRIFCTYNHGKTLQGTPSDTYSVPIGAPVPGGLRADRKGLFTSTRYNTDPESDRILEAIRSGSLKGMSYTGAFVRSDPELQGMFARYAPNADGSLQLVTRLEIYLVEYGPTPIPAYEDAQVVGVRTEY
jgi:HK97 family phage prohead protease